MLIQLPRGAADQPKTSSTDECGAFEAALRRDLATAPVISYDSTIGGWEKRAVDLTLTVLSLPVWLPVLLGAAAWSKLRNSAPVFGAHERIGYGGRAFKCYSLRLDRPLAVIQHLRSSEAAVTPANDLGSIAAHAEDRRAKWGRALERLPRLFNVLRGEMSLVGPSPLAHEDLERFNAGKRYYLSARPGVIGISALADADEEEAGQYKMYKQSWSLMTDALLLWDALRSLRDRGELWKPSVVRRRVRAPAVRQGETPPVVRRRSSGA